MKNIPQKIYLNLGDKSDVEDYDDFNELIRNADVEWSDFRRNETDIEYVLKELKMTSKEKVIEMMVSRGMSFDQAEKVFVKIKDKIKDLVLSYDFTWDRPAKEYPEIIFNLLWITVRIEALKWIEENKPMACFKSMFTY